MSRHKKSSTSQNARINDTIEDSTSDKSNDEKYLNNPYTYFWMLNPWLSNQFIQSWVNMQQIALTHSLEIALWQQTVVQKMLMENVRWIMHCMELHNQPNTLYRYIRMNWLKPYESLATHSITSTRLVSHMWIQSLSAWQDGWRRVTRVE